MGTAIIIYFLFLPLNPYSKPILAVLDCKKGLFRVICAEVPLAEMLGGYSTILRSMTKGRASYSMDFECYREVPKNVEEAVLGKK